MAHGQKHQHLLNIINDRLNYVLLDILYNTEYLIQWVCQN